MRFTIHSLVAGALLAGCGQSPSAQISNPVTITIGRAEQRPFVTTSELSGSLVASRSVTVGANAAGRLSNVPVRIGDHVAAGEIIGAIDAAAYSAALAQASGAHVAAEAEIEQAKASLLQAESRASLAAATAKRDEELYRSGDVSRQHYDETQSASQSAQAGVVAARAAIASASGAAAESAAAINVAAVPLRDSEIRAPFSGVVTQKFVDSGAVVNPGSPIVAMEDDRSLEAEIAVPERMSGALRPGYRVFIRVDAIGAAFPGTVRAMIPSANAQLHTATVRVAMEPHAGLLRGMFVRLRIAGERHEHVAVPWQAVVTRAGQSGVFAIENNHAEFFPVETAQTQNGWVAVDGLRLGTPVAVTGIERLDNGAVVSMR